MCAADRWHVRHCFELSALCSLSATARSAIQQRVAVVDPWQYDAAGNSLRRSLYSQMFTHVSQGTSVVVCTYWRQLRRDCQSACGCRWSRRGSSAETRLIGWYLRHQLWRPCQPNAAGQAWCSESWPQTCWRSATSHSTGTRCELLSCVGWDVEERAHCRTCWAQWQVVCRRVNLWYATFTRADNTANRRRVWYEK